MMRIHIDQLRQRAKTRPVGYLDDCLATGRFDGTWLDLTEMQYAALIEKYRVDLPGWKEVITNFTHSMLAWINAGFPTADKFKFHARLETCEECEHWGNYRCRVCGCFEIKLWLSTEKCPLGKWD